MNRPRQFITSVRVDGNAAHDFVTIFIRGQNVGTLCVGKGDGGRLFALLEPGLPSDETSVTADAPPGKPTDDDESPDYYRGFADGVDTCVGKSPDMVCRINRALQSERARPVPLPDTPPPLSGGESVREVTLRIDPHSRAVYIEPETVNDATQRHRLYPQPDGTVKIEPPIHVTKPSVGEIAERAADNELVRRGLDLDAMNRGRRARCMPELTATAALTLLDTSSQLHAILDRPDVVARGVIAGMRLDTLCPDPFEPDGTNVERARLFGMTETDLRLATERFVTRARNFEIRHQDWQRAFSVYLHKHYQPAKPPLGYERHEPCPCGHREGPHPDGWCDEGYEKAGEE